MHCKRSALSLLLVLCLAACSGEPPPVSSVPSPSPSGSLAPVDFQAFLQSVNADRRAALETESIIDLSPWTADFSDQPNPFTQEEMELLLTPHKGQGGPYTTQQLTEDAEAAFSLLKTTYGAYDYFGGDEVFLPLLEEVKAELADTRYPTPSILSDLLRQALTPVLKDGHFSIDGKHLIAGSEQTMYYVPGLYFDDPSGLDPDYIKPTVADDGRIAYGFAALTHDPFPLPNQIVMDGVEVPLSWKAASPIGWWDSDAYRETQWEGLPVLQSRSMMSRNPEQEAQLERFASSGPDWAGYSSFVFDVRSNSGGKDNYVMDWFEGFASQPARPKRSFARKYSPLGVLGMGYPADRLGTWCTYSSEGTFVENERLIILLQDAATASSGETAVRYLRSLNNVLILGSNSGGCALVSNNLHFYLPHTGLALFFGTGLSFTETAENRDGVGYLPDLWVDPADAQQAVIRLCKYYDLI